jgi:hypothetical protein
MAAQNLKKSPASSKHFLKDQSGITLKETVLVMLLVSVFTLVAIIIIDPARVRAAVLDAELRATLYKIALFTNGHTNSYGVVPDEKDFSELFIKDFQEFVKKSCSGQKLENTYTCLFTFDQLTLPETCDSSHWKAQEVANNQCFIRYSATNKLPKNSYGSVSKQQYRLYAQSTGVANSVYVYDNLEGATVYLCPNEINDSLSLDICTSTL